jgi:hypothetical protein
MNYWLQFLFVFLSVGIGDVCWAMYFLKIGQERSLAAGCWGGMIVFLTAYTAIEYINDHTLIIPAVLGGFAGTYATVEYHRRKNKWKRNL